MTVDIIYSILIPFIGGALLYESVTKRDATIFTLTILLLTANIIGLAIKP